jgi:Riboflavin synthase alpha chain
MSEMIMYSGITRGLFDVISVDKQSGLFIYQVELNPILVNHLSCGDSVAIDGVCQTVVCVNGNTVTFHAMAETLAKTTLIDLYCGRKVSVERSLRVGDENGGHDLAGHVFDVGKILEKRVVQSNLALVIQCPKSCIDFIFVKGFIGVDGSSLTVGEVNPEDATFVVHLTPQTIELTQFAQKQPGEKVNLELDAKTVAIVETTKRYFDSVLIRLEKIEQTLTQLTKP